MVDIHVIPNPGFEENLIETIRALQHPRTRVQVGNYVPGNMLDARIQAYSMGSCPYVSWVDCDDRVIDISWIEMAIDILDSYPHVAAVYPRWQVVQKGKINPSPRDSQSPMQATTL